METDCHADPEPALHHLRTVAEHEKDEHEVPRGTPDGKHTRLIRTTPPPCIATDPGPALQHLTTVLGEEGQRCRELLAEHLKRNGESPQPTVA